MIGKDSMTFRITSSYVNSHLVLKASSLAIDTLEESCLKKIEKTHSKKGLLVIEQTDSRDMSERASIFLYDDYDYEIENPALGETEDGTKVILMPVVLGDNGIEFTGVLFIETEQDGVN